MKYLILLIASLSLSACNVILDTSQDELSAARAAIAKSKAAGAEQCAPKLQAEAVANLYWAAHELSEGQGHHPDENAELIAAAESKAKQALESTNLCHDLDGVNFETNSAQLTAASTAILNRAVVTLKRLGLNVEVAAHTDSRGSDSYNMALSNRRAASVKKYLVDHGVRASSLTSKGYGETQPIASNDTAAGRAKNRRVELRTLN